MRKSVISVLAAVMVAAVLVGGCAKSSPTPAPAPAPAPSKTLDIGIITPLTGPSAFIGTEMQNGILLAMDVQNEQGGVTIGGEKYTLNPLIRDSKMDLMLGKSSAEELIFDKGVKVIGGPFVGDALGVQTVTEPNKVISFLLLPLYPTMTGPSKPYSFFFAPPFEELYADLGAYIQKFYPEAKTVLSMAPDLPDLPIFTNAAQKSLPQYGLEWMGVEKFPSTTTDFAPVISRALAKKPDIIDTASTPGSMGALCALLIKQLREAGFNGIIMMPGNPPPGVMEEVVPKQSLTKIVNLDVNPDSPMVSKTYRDVYYRAKSKYNEVPASLLLQCYDIPKAFFEFLNTQNTMDATAWMESFANFHWQGIWGIDSYWVGKPQIGINRLTLRSGWCSEYKDGKLETNFDAPIPYDMFVEK